MLNIINLTPHTVTVGGKEFSPCGRLARVGIATDFIGARAGGVPLVRETLLEPDGVPPETLGTMYIVSRMVFDALPNRGDLLVPTEMIRDAEGRITGARYFACRVFNRQCNCGSEYPATVCPRNDPYCG